MKTGLILSVCLVFGLPAAVEASGAGKPSLNPTVLGLGDGIAAFCIKIDERNEERYEQLRRSLIAGYSVQEVDAARSDPAFRTNVHLAKDVLSSMSRRDALGVCADAIKH